MQKNELHFECEVTIDDGVAWNLYHFDTRSDIQKKLKINRYIWMPVMTLFFLAGVFFIVMNFFIGTQLWFSILLIVLGAGGFFYYLFLPRIAKRGIGKQVDKMYSQGKNTVIGNHKYQISQEGIHDISELDETTTRWDAIDSVVQTDEHLFIIVRPASAFIVPKRSFPSDDAFHQVFLDVKELCEESKLS